MRFVTDQRAVEGAEAPEAEAFLREAIPQLRSLQLQIGQRLLEIQRKGHYRLSGFGQIGSYGREMGLGVGETLSLLDVSRGTEACSDLGDAVASARVPLPAAAEVSKILCAPRLLGDDPRGERACEWVSVAQTHSFRDVRRSVRRRIEEVAQRESPLQEVVAYVSAQVAGHLRRCQVLASRRAGQHLTMGQTLAVLVREDLRRNDPLLAPPPREGKPRASWLRRSRHIPASVAKAVRKRARDRCEVGTCTNDTYLQYMHLQPFAVDGPHTSQNVVLGCTCHHTLLDAGLIRHVGWTSHGHPVFVTSQGRRLEPGTPRTEAPPPPRHDPHAASGG